MNSARSNKDKNDKTKQNGDQDSANWIPNNANNNTLANKILIKKEEEITILNYSIRNLKETISDLEKENYELKLSVTQNTKDNSLIKSLNEKIEMLEAENKETKLAISLNEQQFIKEKNDLKKKMKEEHTFLDDKIQGLQLKIDANHNEEIIYKSQKFQVKELEEEIKRIKNQHEENNKRAEFKNTLKFSDLKAKMMHSIETAKKNSAELNSAQLDINSKLTLLQNHQMIVELEFQSKQIEDLIKEKQTLERKLLDTQKEMEIEKNVQLILADKNKSLCITLKKLANEVEVNKTILTDNNYNSKYNNTSDSMKYSPLKTDYKETRHTHTKSYFNPKITNSTNTKFNFNPINTIQYKNENNLDLSTKSTFKNYNNIKYLTNEENLLRKIHNLEYELEKKKIDLENLKSSHDLFQEKLKQIERKYYGIFTLFDEGLNQLSKEISMGNSNEIYINLENMKKRDFIDLPAEKKFSMLLLLMKKITPLIKLDDLEDSNYLKLLDGSNIKVKSHMKIKKIREMRESDFEVKKYFAGNSILNFPTANKSLMESLPMFNIKNKVYSQQNSILDKKFENSKQD